MEVRSTVAQLYQSDVMHREVCVGVRSKHMVSKVMRGKRTRRVSVSLTYAVQLEVGVEQQILEEVLLALLGTGRVVRLHLSGHLLHTFGRVDVAKEKRVARHFAEVDEDVAERRCGCGSEVQ